MFAEYLPHGLALSRALRCSGSVFPPCGCGIACIAWVGALTICLFVIEDLLRHVRCIRLQREYAWAIDEAGFGATYMICYVERKRYAETAMSCVSPVYSFTCAVNWQVVLVYVCA